MLTKISKHRATGAEDLVDLLSECHRKIRRFIALARQAGSRQDVPAVQIVQACVDVERYFGKALPLHVADEEESIEPRLRGLSTLVDDALEAMAHQHQQHVTEVEALLRASASVRRQPHDDAVRSELEAIAVALENEFERHLALEEKVIFPAIRDHLSAEIRRDIVHELRDRRGVGSFSDIGEAQPSPVEGT